LDYRWEADSNGEMAARTWQLAYDSGHNIGDVLRASAGWRRVLYALTEQFAVADVNQGALDSGATDVDSNCLACHSQFSDF
jgi:hypothetical protein